MHTKINNFGIIRAIACIFMLIASNCTIVAQDIENNDEQEDTKTNQSFRFVYIAQGSQEEMPVEELKKQMEAAWTGITNGPVIFYLSRGTTDNPVIVKANCKEDSNPEEERKMFDEQIIERLQNNIQYTIMGTYDKQQILELLKNNDIVNSDGQPIYKETFLEFHVGQDFWDSGNNETVIASLFFELDVSNHIDAGDNFHCNVFAPRNLKTNDEEEFGLLNPDDCKKYINLERIY